MHKDFGSWDDGFPLVMHLIDLERVHPAPYRILQAHPDYNRAKYHEDRAAASRLVLYFLSLPENLQQLKYLERQYAGSIIVSVHAHEAFGKNRIPQILSTYIGNSIGLEVDNTIVQTNTVNHSRENEWHRFAFRPTFEGTVKAGQSYLLVDDIYSLGGTFNELRRFIETNNGKVLQTIALATGRSGPEIALSDKTLNALVDKYGKENLSSFLKENNLYEGNYKALTEPEARALRRAASLDQARDRILAARQEAYSRMGEEKYPFNQKKPVTKKSFHR